MHTSLLETLLNRKIFICGITETVSHFLLDCPRHTTLRQQFFFSLLDIPETISLNLLIFRSVNLNDEENFFFFFWYTAIHPLDDH
jgi:hypothetical protein